MTGTRGAKNKTLGTEKCVNIGILYINNINSNNNNNNNFDCDITWD